ncbi:AI-2E family transporter [Variovorax robiniae]|uniref:AI-2E family transporter n=1 Tax=Variovorax robiniae TaxID=1836199 RepID=A0ABU8X6J4_9BURK
MNDGQPPDPQPPPASVRREVALAILAGTAVLALLYFGREVLVPITLALILSLAVAPIVRLLRQVGLGQVIAVLTTAAGLAVLLVGMLSVIGVQMVQIAQSLPQYESTIRLKAQSLRGLTLDRVEAIEGAARKVTDHLGEATAEAPELSAAAASVPGRAVPVEVRTPRPGALERLTQVASSTWAPLQTAGIVLVVLLFALLEHESLRDRFIRLAGGADLRSTTTAINDAGERLSRFFVSQFAVNFGVGLVLWAGLALVGLPHAGLWAVLTAVLRFVPYVGVVAAALSAGLLAAAVDPGWTLVLLTLGIFVLVEVVVSQLIEPQLYGHTTGLSPLSVVVSAIFWSWLWGPVGLIVSTPLTLCLVVAGRHVKALGFLDVLLGDTQALTLPQRFYQRALSGDADEIIAAARVFLKRRPFAAYCDLVLLRAMYLARQDLGVGAISPEQQHKVRGAIVAVVDALGGATRSQRRRYARATVLDDISAGRLLRDHRVEATGKWQGSLTAPAGTVVLCLGMGSIGDDLATELLVRILRDLRIDARHVLIEEVVDGPPPGATAESLSMMCVVSVLPLQHAERRHAVMSEIHRRLPQLPVMSLLFPEAPGGPVIRSEHAGELVVGSFEEAAQHAMSHFEGRNESLTAKSA